MESKIEVIKAIIDFQGKVPTIELNSEVTVKLKTGGSYKFKYADLPYIVETIQPTLTECKLCIHYELNTEQIILHVIHESGQEFTSFMPMKLGSNAQENGSIITYYKRYLLTSSLNLVAEEDDDANINVGNKAEHKKKAVKALPVLTEKSKHWKNISERFAQGEIDLKKIKEAYTVAPEIETLLTIMLESVAEDAFIKQSEEHAIKQNYNSK